MILKNTANGHFSLQTCYSLFRRLQGDKGRLVTCQRKDRWSTALFMLEFGARWGCFFNAKIQKLYSWKRATIPSAQEAGSTPKAGVYLCAEY
jgi:hypothetical protein